MNFYEATQKIINRLKEEKNLVRFSVESYHNRDDQMIMDIRMENENMTLRGTDVSGRLSFKITNVKESKKRGQSAFVHAESVNPTISWSSTHRSTGAAIVAVKHYQAMIELVSEMELFVAGTMIWVKFGTPEENNKQVRDAYLDYIKEKQAQHA